MTVPDYDYMFGQHEPLENDPEDLNRLARFMVGNDKFPVPPILTESSSGMKSVPDELAFFIGRPGLPAGYTYFGQFVDHDISSDSRGDRETESHLPFGLSKVRSINQHRPIFDLQTIYGARPIDEKGDFTAEFTTLMADSVLPFMKIGRTRGEIQLPFDLPRRDGYPKAEIADPRSDSNLLLAQMHLLFLKVHNAAVVRLHRKYKSPRDLFAAARTTTIRIYQHLIWHDYVSRIAEIAVLDSIKNDGNRFFRPVSLDSAFVPYEFAAAAFRFGHSMIRRSYRLNRQQLDGTIGRVQNQTGKARFGGSGTKLSIEWAVDWRMFFHGDTGLTVNFANPIDTDMRDGLTMLVPGHKHNDPRNFSLTALDLFRGAEKQLADGQTYADLARSGYPNGGVLSSTTIGDLFTNARISSDPGSFEKLGDIFSERTPLWFYVLAESESGIQVDSEGYRRLGLLGSVIVAETIAGLLRISPYSVLVEPLGQMDDEKVVFEQDDLRSIDFRDVLWLVQGVNEEYQKVLYPDIKLPFDDLYPDK